MTYALRIAGVAGTVTNTNTPDLFGQYIESYDPEAHMGRGLVQGTWDLARAQRFADMREVVEFICQVSETRPVRDDGQPNRPLRALNLEIVRVP